MGCIVLLALLLCHLDRIVLAGSYRWILLYSLYWIGWIGLDHIVSYRLDEDTSDFMHWQVTANMGRMDWMWHCWDGDGTDGH